MTSRPEFDDDMDVEMEAEAETLPIQRPVEFLDLPPEIIESVASQMDAPDMRALAGTSRYIRDVTQQARNRKTRCMRDSYLNPTENVKQTGYDLLEAIIDDKGVNFDFIEGRYGDLGYIVAFDDFQMHFYDNTNGSVIFKDSERQYTAKVFPQDMQAGYNAFANAFTDSKLVKQAIQDVGTQTFSRCTWFDENDDLYCPFPQAMLINGQNEGFSAQFSVYLPDNNLTVYNWEERAEYDDRVDENEIMNVALMPVVTSFKIDDVTLLNFCKTMVETCEWMYENANFDIQKVMMGKVNRPVKCLGVDAPLQWVPLVVTTPESYTGMPLYVFFLKAVLEDLYTYAIQDASDVNEENMLDKFYFLDYTNYPQTALYAIVLLLRNMSNLEIDYRILDMLNDPNTVERLKMRLQSIWPTFSGNYRTGDEIEFPQEMRFMLMDLIE